MTKRLILPIETLRKLLRYDPDTGMLYWRERPREFCKSDGRQLCWNKLHAGKPALTAVSANGGMTGNILGVKFVTARVAFAIHNGYWPDQVDHINHNRLDNRDINLRDVDHHENHRNHSFSKANTSGHTGVRKEKGVKNWRAEIKVNGRLLHLGVFAELIDAIAAREAANVKYGFHANHGK